MFPVSALTATAVKTNQDRVLVNKDLFDRGINHLQNLDNLFCFVADGIGSLAKTVKMQLNLFWNS